MCESVLELIYINFMVANSGILCEQKQKLMNFKNASALEFGWVGKNIQAAQTILSNSYFKKESFLFSDDDIQKKSFKFLIILLKFDGQKKEKD